MTIKKIQNSFPQLVVQLFILIFTALLEVIAMNMFLNPNHIFTGGFNGISQLLSIASKHLFGFQINTGIFILLTSVVIGFLGGKWSVCVSRF
ncbi:hypothetical protein ATX24_04225 [Oenococcus oeni]|nr:YitT family protein [Oenococcus oeni]KGH56478.1 hypothetical protein X289_08565 [Oenococcus oeni IOEB_B10]KGH81914.1 hypothetical protein X460_08180 [Oenococcus oeni S15]KGH91220.1 hypothetical protein X461_07230 [Oenococcus oeni S161]KGH93522.1 hypothetical protein X300_08280 [Oenococcus oeni IOEB_S436a]KGH98785.1 hypothetical protein X295_07165 [Oenococcus oeni IOEB_L18_3]